MVSSPTADQQPRTVAAFDACVRAAEAQMSPEPFLPIDAPSVSLRTSHSDSTLSVSVGKIPTHMRIFPVRVTRSTTSDTHWESFSDAGNGIGIAILESMRQEV